MTKFSSPSESPPVTPEARPAPATVPLVPAGAGNLSWRDAPSDCHHRCMHCGEYADECQCDGGWS